jgi:HYR domain.
MCSFTVTVQDTQPPTITCPANQTVVTDQNLCPAPTCATVNFPAPTTTDNCPGVIVVCNPPSGGCLPVGVTSVTCTATDASGNTATCSFAVSVFDTVLQDDANPSIVLLWNSLTGAYRFCCNGTVYTGIGKSLRQGCVYTLDHTGGIVQRVLGRVDKAVHSGTASLQAPPGTTRCTITDRNTLNDFAVCQ